MTGLRESGWCEMDSLLAQAWSDIEAQRCRSCGHPLWMALDPQTEGRWAVDLPSRCLPCTAIAEKAEPYLKDSRHPHALKFGAELVSG